MGFPESVSDAELILGEGSIYERLRRQPDIQYDPDLAHAALIYDDVYGARLADVHREYLAIGRDHDLPMLVTAGTQRANRDRLGRSAFSKRHVNQDHLAFMRALCDGQPGSPPLFLAGVLAPRGDAYKPEQGLATDAALSFHRFQADALAEGEPDLLIAWTLPALPEALGLARAMEATGLPYALSFVVRDSGHLLDGSSLDDAVASIDASLDRPPFGFFINCVHPSVCDAALHASSTATVERVVGLKANTSALRPEEIDDSPELLSEDPAVLAAGMASVRTHHDLRIVAGCCGTGTEHMAQIARACKEPT